ncbi:alpha/beta hydrolase [Embleya sp. NBC_00888]|uniref:alpha/beta hydrolase family protein n=1 Tax=Embleya sp. NBC_00888 TaxID=2975960 RepID=UPI00386F5426|nr:alpha/beta hydrolase [Embleya sp. NBC_00888]
MSASRDILTRPAAGPDRTLRYGPAADHVVDLWQPAAEPHALVVVVHGGYWRAEYDRKYTYPMCVALAAEGYAVASLEYRRAGQPGGGRPGTFEDVAAALDLLCTKSEQPVVLLGHSAGGHLAVWAALRDRVPAGGVGWLPAAPPIAGAVSLAGVLDLDAALALDLDDGAAAEFLGADRSEATLAQVDPVRLAAGGLGDRRLILLHGDADEQVPIALGHTFAAASGLPLRELPGIGHFEPVDPLSAIWPEVTRAVGELAV